MILSEVVMTNDHKVKAAQDRLFINIDQPFEIRYWTTVLGVDEEDLKDVISKVGPSADRVREHIAER